MQYLLPLARWISIGSFFFLLTAAPYAYATTFTWDGGGSDDNWNTAANWNPTGIPGSSGSVVFNGTSADNALINVNVRIHSLTITSAYTGTITQSGAMVVGTGSWIQGGGTFQGGSAPILIFGSLTLSGGTLGSTSGILTLSGSLQKTGGTFTHRSGTVAMASPSNRTLSGSLAFHRLDIESTKETGLLAYWKFDEGSGATVSDFSGNRNDGTRRFRPDFGSDTPTLLYPNPRRGGDAAGSADAFMTSFKGGDITGDTTMSIWFKTSSTQPYQAGIFEYKLTTGGHGLQIDMSPSGAVITDNDGGPVNSISTSTAKNDGQWHHAAATRSGTTYALYVDGVLIGTDTGGTAPAYRQLYAGSRGGTLGFFGVYDDARIYSRALSATEIADLAAGRYPTRTGASTTTLTSPLTVVGALSVHNGTFAIGTQTVSAAGATLSNFATFSRTSGSFLHAGSLSGTPSSLNAGGGITVTLTESDQNTDGTTRETKQIVTEGETITLTETTAYSGIFTGSINTAHAIETSGNGIIEHDDRCSYYVRFAYIDPQDNTDSLTASVLVNDAANACEVREEGGGGGGGGGTRSSGTTPSTTVSSSSAHATSSASPNLAQTPDTGNHDFPTTQGMVVAVINGQQIIFHDVPADTWFAPFVSDLLESGIASGYDDDQGNPLGLFGPADFVTYAQIAKMALQTAGLVGLSDKQPVNLSARNDWSAPYIAQAEALGLSLYTPTLDVTLPSTRGAVIATLLEASGIPLIQEPVSIFDDLRPSHPHFQAIATAAALGIINGDTDAEGKFTGTVRPDDFINRAEVAKIIMRWKEVRP